MSRAETKLRERFFKLTIILAVVGPLLFSGRAAAQDKRPLSPFLCDEFTQLEKV